MSHFFERKALLGFILVRFGTIIEVLEMNLQVIR